jgi:hypothetical protein
VADHSVAGAVRCKGTGRNLCRRSARIGGGGCNDQGYCGEDWYDTGITYAVSFRCGCRVAGSACAGRFCRAGTKQDRRFASGVPGCSLHAGRSAALPGSNADYCVFLALGCVIRRPGAVDAHRHSIRMPRQLVSAEFRPMPPAGVTDHQQPAFAFRETSFLLSTPTSQQGFSL